MTIRKHAIFRNFIIFLLVFCIVVVVPVREAHAIAPVPLAILASNYGLVIGAVVLAFLVLSTIESSIEDPAFTRDDVVALAKWIDGQFKSGASSLFASGRIKYFELEKLFSNGVIYMTHQVRDLIAYIPDVISGDAMANTITITDTTISSSYPRLLDIIDDIPYGNFKYHILDMPDSNYIYYFYNLTDYVAESSKTLTFQDVSPYNSGKAAISISMAQGHPGQVSAQPYIAVYDTVSKSVLYNKQVEDTTSMIPLYGDVNYNFHTGRWDLGMYDMKLEFPVDYSGYIGFSNYRDSISYTSSLVIGSEAVAENTLDLDTTKIKTAAASVTSGVMRDNLDDYLPVIGAGLGLSGVSVPDVVPDLSTSTAADGVFTNTGGVSNAEIGAGTAIPGDVAIDNAVVQTGVDSLYGKLKPKFLVGFALALENMSNTRGEPPKITINLRKLFNAGVSEVSPEYVDKAYADEEATFIDFSMVNEYEFMGFGMIDFVRNVIGAAMIMGTINYIRRKLQAVTTQH